MIFATFQYISIKAAFIQISVACATWNDSFSLVGGASGAIKINDNKNNLGFQLLIYGGMKSSLLLLPLSREPGTSGREVLVLDPPGKM